MGTTYWTPLRRGEAYVSATDLAAKFVRPYPGVYVCGESYSADKQAWVEGALESAEKVLKAIKL